MSDKLKKMSGVSVVSDHALAVEILQSDAFNVVNLGDYLLRLQQNSEMNFELLIKFVSYSPFFIEGDRHLKLKKILSAVFGKSNLVRWQATFENEIESVTNKLEFSSEIDLVNYCFDVLKTLFRPMIGLGTILPDDFEPRLYRFQKLVEPLLSIRQLMMLQDELSYLISCLKNSLDKSREPIPNSLLLYLQSEADSEFSYEDKLMLLLVAYGAKTPLIQTLGNVFLDILVDNRERYFNGEVFDEEYFIKDLDEVIHRTASLLYIHRIATRDFQCANFVVKQGAFVLIEIGSAFVDSSASGCGFHKSLGFGSGAHYCSGALTSKLIISMVIPTFFKMYPHATAKSWEYDSSIQTAKSLKTLKGSTR
jgi:cytochrome P450